MANNPSGSSSVYPIIILGFTQVLFTHALSHRLCGSFGGRSAYIALLGAEESEEDTAALAAMR